MLSWMVCSLNNCVHEYQPNNTISTLSYCQSHVSTISPPSDLVTLRPNRSSTANYRMMWWQSWKRMTTALQGRHHTRTQSGSLNELNDMVGECVMRAITGFLTEGYCWNTFSSTKSPTCVLWHLHHSGHHREILIEPKHTKNTERERSRRSWKTYETWSHEAKTV